MTGNTMCSSKVSNVGKRAPEYALEQQKRSWEEDGGKQIVIHNPDIKNTPVSDAGMYAMEYIHRRFERSRKPK